jgi:hypothetical protein
MTGQRWTLGLTLVSALRLGAKLVTRHRGVAHVYHGPLTRSARFVPADREVVCGVRTKRLSVLLDGPDALGAAADGLRLCRRCAPLLEAFPPDSPYAGRVLVTLDDKAAAFAHLNALDFGRAAKWCRTVAETHQVGMLMGLVLGPPPLRPKTPDQVIHKAADEALNRRRKQLRLAELTPEERAEREAKRLAEEDELIRIRSARGRQARIDRAQDRANRGQYLMPHERDLLQKQADAANRGAL